MYYLLSVLLIVWGVFSFLKPEIVWEIQHFLEVEGGEPTDFALFSNRVGGVVFALVGIVSFVILLIVG